MTILKPLSFCIYKGQELGIVTGYFAGNAWKVSDAAFNSITGRSFGWLDSKGMEYRDDKSSFTRPTEDQIISMMTPQLEKMALHLKLISK